MAVAASKDGRIFNMSELYSMKSQNIYAVIFCSALKFVAQTYLCMKRRMEGQTMLKSSRARISISSSQT